MSLVIALFLPITAINSFAGKKRNTDAVYDMMPFTSADIVLGKYLSCVVQTLIPTLVIVIIYPILASMFAPSFDMAVTYSSGIAFIFFSMALLSVYFFIAVRSKTRLRAYIYSYIVAILWYLLGIAVAALPLTPLASFISFSVVMLILAVALYFLFKSVWIPVIAFALAEGVLTVLFFTAPHLYMRTFELVCMRISVFNCFDRFVCGVFDLQSFFYFIIIIVAFMTLSVRRYESRYDGDIRRDGLRIRKITSAAVVPLVLVLAMAFNVGAALVPDRYTVFDSTESGKNSVSDTAREYLAGLDKEVTVYLLEPTGLAPNYEHYLDELVSCSDKITLQKIYYANNPEFYSERGINTESITVNSLVIQSGERYQYLPYLSLFTYTNETLGFTEISATEYNSYYQMFAASSVYADYMKTLEYDTKTNFCADKVICSFIEYVTSDIIPTQYMLTGHGESGTNDANSPYYGIPTIEISDNGIPADAASILINLPAKDVSEDEKTALLEYLERGGQLTFVTDERVFEMPNLLSILSSYGMSAQRSFLEVEVDDGYNNKTNTSELKVAIKTDNDVLYALDGKNLAATVKNANVIQRNPNARENLLHYPLVTYTETVDETEKTHILACAAETDNGARVAWFTGGKSYNDVNNNAGAAVLYTLSWTSMKYTSDVPEMPSVMYQSTMSKVESGASKVFGALLIVIPIGFMVIGGVSWFKRKII
jgi:ABC-2 type transport system permease protein